MSYDGLQPSGALGATVKDFILFPDYDCKMAFLEPSTLGLFNEHHKKFGCINVLMLLDATEIRADVALMKTLNVTLYLIYKHNSTIK